MSKPYVFKAKEGCIAQVRDLKPKYVVRIRGPVDLTTITDEATIEKSLKSGDLRRNLEAGFIVRTDSTEEVKKAPEVVKQPEKVVLPLDEEDRKRTMVFEHLRNGINLEMISTSLNIPMEKVLTWKEEYDTPADDLTVISGVNQAREDQLNKAGIKTYKQLSSLTANELKQRLMSNEHLNTINGWIKQAKKLVEAKAVNEKSASEGEKKEAPGQ